jgi:hypothetical protein
MLNDEIKKKLIKKDTSQPKLNCPILNDVMKKNYLKNSKTNNKAI